MRKPPGLFKGIFGDKKEKEKEKEEEQEQSVETMPAYGGVVSVCDAFGNKVKSNIYPTTEELMYGGHFIDYKNDYNTSFAQVNGNKASQEDSAMFSPVSPNLRLDKIEQTNLDKYGKLAYSLAQAKFNYLMQGPLANQRQTPMYTSGQEFPINYKSGSTSTSVLIANNMMMINSLGDSPAYIVTFKLGKDGKATDVILNRLNEHH